MSNFRLLSFLTSNLDIDADFVGDLIANCKTAGFAKGDFLLRQGEYCRHSFFVESGLLRQYAIDEKAKEHVLQFAPENWFVTDRETVYFNQPSQYYIQALEDSRVLLLDENFLRQLAQQQPAFTGFNNRLLHNHIRHLQKRILLLLSASAEERYLDFVSLYPDILLRVPQTMVASYLGITPESLSRVRKELARKNFRY